MAPDVLAGDFRVMKRLMWPQSLLRVNSEDNYVAPWGVTHNEFDVIDVFDVVLYHLWRLRVRRQLGSSILPKINPPKQRDPRL